MRCIQDGLEACAAHLRLPVTHRYATRTTSLLERLFVEERHRLIIISNGVGEKAELKLMFGALIRAAEPRRGVRLTGFETRRLSAVRDDLDEEHTAAITPDAQTPQPNFPSKPQPRPPRHRPAPGGGARGHYAGPRDGRLLRLRA